MCRRRDAPTVKSRPSSETRCVGCYVAGSRCGGWAVHAASLSALVPQLAKARFHLNCACKHDAAPLLVLSCRHRAATARRQAAPCCCSGRATRWSPAMRLLPCIALQSHRHRYQRSATTVAGSCCVRVQLDRHSTHVGAGTSTGPLPLQHQRTILPRGFISRHAGQRLHMICMRTIALGPRCMQHHIRAMYRCQSRGCEAERRCRAC